MQNPAPAPRQQGSPAGSAAPSSARKIWVDLLLYPTHTLPTALAPVLVGAGLAARDGVLALGPALVGFLGSWLIHVAGVFTDNHELLRLHPELEEHPELNQAVRDGSLRLSTLAAAVAACLAGAVLTAPFLYRIGGAPVIAYGVVGIAASLGYHGAPSYYVRRGLADPIFFLMFAVVAVPATYFIQAAATAGAPEPWRLLAGLPPAAWLVGVPCGALVTAVMLVDDLRDREFDRVKGWRNGAVVLGPGFVRAEITALVVVAYAAPLADATVLGLGPWTLLPLASAPLGWRTVATIRAATRREQLAPMSPAMARIALLHSALLGLGLALSR